MTRQPEIAELGSGVTSTCHPDPRTSECPIRFDPHWMLVDRHCRGVRHRCDRHSIESRRIGPMCNGEGSRSDDDSADILNFERATASICLEVKPVILQRSVRLQ